MSTAHQSRANLAPGDHRRTIVGVQTSLDLDRVERRAAELVGTPSPTGAERDAIELVAHWLRQGAADRVDHWEAAMADLEGDPAYPGREVERSAVPVVAARAAGDGPGPTVLLTGHVDTVPPGDRRHWSVDPEAETVVGDRLYGRGAADMKGGLVAALEVFEALAAGPRDFPGEIRFVAVPGEEDGGTGTLAAIRRGWTGDFAVIAEPTAGTGGHPDVVVAHAGAITLTIGVAGRAAHAATRLEGVSALEQYFTVHRALRTLEERLNRGERRPELRALGVPYPTCVGKVRGGDWASNVMDRLEVEVRAGVVVGESVAAAEERFRTTLLEAVRRDAWLADHPPSVVRTGAGFGSAEIAPDHPLVGCVSAAAGSVLGAPPALVAKPYGCDMAMWMGVGGVATVVYGPGDVRLAHAADEWVSLRQVTTAARVLEEAAARILRLPPGRGWSPTED